MREREREREITDVNNYVVLKADLLDVAYINDVAILQTA